MQCDICGKELALVKTKIEGIELNVCANCSRFGKVLPKPAQPAPIFSRPAKPKEEPPAQIVVRDYASLIRKARESMGLNQEDFAKRISEKASLVHNMESGRFEPPLGLAKKLERFLRIRLVEDYKEENLAQKKKSDNVITIGDIISLP